MMQVFARELEELALPCLRGYPSANRSRTFCGGLPWVDEDFLWPRKEGKPLQFVGQIECGRVDDWHRSEGLLLFFYDNEHWGSRATDLGHIQVFWQQGLRELAEVEIPSYPCSRFFGLSHTTFTPKTTKKVFLELKPSLSHPAPERLGFHFPDEESSENYSEFLAAQASPMQIGGYPYPIQADTMEADCALALGIPSESWQLLAQMEEMGDQCWGDSGSLYWFVPVGDLKDHRYDRIWMVSQCY